MTGKFKAHTPAGGSKTPTRPLQPAQSGKKAADSGADSGEPEVIDTKPGDKSADDPTRFGDWSVAGRCIDF